MKSIFIFLISACAIGSPNEQENDSVLIEQKQDDRIIVGAERVSSYLPLLEGMKVGVVANQSSMLGAIHLVDTLMSFDIDIKSVFSPEHGFRGKADAGELVKSNVDQETGLPVVSLYGSNKKPTAEQMKGIEVMIFDIQDVGVRFYTYISTLHYIMEACAENDVLLIVLDRPNPNGHYVDGPVLDLKYKSFVGMHAVPIVHGMTIAEYGGMINGEGWLPNGVQCNLNVVKCENYTHDTPYSLPIPPSPNLRSDISIQLYPSLCLLEATTVSIGRGTEGPFERYGHPDFPYSTFSFTPKSGRGSKYPKHQDVNCNGYDLNEKKYERLNQFDLSFLVNSNAQLKGKPFITQTNFFNKLAGNNILISQLKNNVSESEIRASWKEDLIKYREMRKEYLLYK